LTNTQSQTHAKIQTLQASKDKMPASRHTRSSHHIISAPYSIKTHLLYSATCHKTIKGTWKYHSRQ